MKSSELISLESARDSLKASIAKREQIGATHSNPSEFELSTQKERARLAEIESEITRITASSSL